MFITTSATPLSAVKTILEGSFFSSAMAILSPLVMLGFGFCIFWMATLTWTLNSSTLPSSNLVHACSIAATSCMVGGSFSTMAKFGPWANNLSSSVDSGLSEMFMTHVFLFYPFGILLFWFWSFWYGWSPLPLWKLFEWPPLSELLFWHKASSSIFCLDMVL